MKKVLIFCSALMIASIQLWADEQADSLKLVELEEVIVSSTRAGSNTPIAYSNLNAVDIKKDNTARNIPFILQTLPSVVAYSEDGSGVGNTSLRIRGVDATRINVTLNGMPLNNPETQEVYWVNYPDLSNSLQSAQLQRGVGTSTFGSAAFGASLSLKTTGSRQEAYGEASTAIGSYNTFLSSLAAGTGILKSGLSFDARYSRVTGDGYIRNGKVNHKNLYAALSHYTDNQLIRLSYINGIQHTGITWEGISPDDMTQYGRKYNIAGQYTDEAGNVHYYDNETDNYYSDIVQLLFSRELNRAWTLNANISYNHGYGYYENYKEDESFSEFGLEDQVIDGVTYSESDIIRRLLMSNDLYAGNVSLEYSTDKFIVTGGLMTSWFDGNHYGRLPWIKYSSTLAAGYEWNRNTATKKEISGFGKIEYKITDRISAFGDLQYRYIDYRMNGMDDDLADITNKSNYSFFNPKAGLTVRVNSSNTIYGSVGISNREPLRADIKESVKGGGSQRIKSERVIDYELGYRFKNEGASFNANLYYMNYKDQMVQTGKLNDVGYKLMENVPESYRAGIELEGSYLFADWLHLGANATFSTNKIKDYTAYFDEYDTNRELTGQREKFHKSTNISFSPNIVGSGILTVLPAKNTTISLVGKYVGEQYYDNTSNSANRLDGYFVSNLIAGYTFPAQKIGNIDLQLTINNLFNNHYIANAWVDTSYVNDTPDVYKGFFPQATRNIMAKVGVRF